MSDAARRRSNSYWVPEYNTFDLGGRYSARIFGRLTTFLLTVNNVTNVHYYSTLGRAVSLARVPLTSHISVTPLDHGIHAVRVLKPHDRFPEWHCRLPKRIEDVKKNRASQMCSLACNSSARTGTDSTSVRADNRMCAAHRSATHRLPCRQPHCAFKPLFAPSPAAQASRSRMSLGQV